MADVAEHNRLNFNDQASSYNKRYEVGIKQITEDIQERRDWISVDLVDANFDEAAAKKPLRVLDYACGTGLVSHALKNYSAQFTGIDLSENMVKEYNTRAASDGIPATRMHAHLGNLMTPDEPAAFDGAEFFGFDIAFVGLGFHHFPDPALAAQRLARRLRSGGRLVIVDNLAENDTGLGHTGLDHSGFSSESLRKMFEEAGVGRDFDFAVLSRPLKLGKGEDAREQRLFMAKGTKV